MVQAASKAASPRLRRSVVRACSRSTLLSSQTVPPVGTRSAAAAANRRAARTKPPAAAAVMACSSRQYEISEDIAGLALNSGGFEPERRRASTLSSD